MFDDFISQMDEKWRDSFVELMATIDEHIPAGFEKTIEGKMIAYNVPLSTYEKGYHVTPNTPLPFIAIAAQKRHLALYHLGIYGDESLLHWFQEEYAKQVPTKLNMGKSCIRWTSTKHIPFELIGELVEKISMEQWIELYENNIK